MTPSLAIFVQDIVLRTVSFQLMWPVMFIMPEIELSKVVLPAPFEPIMQTIFPSSTTMLIPLRASIGP